mmetsp:Transcript_16689/g.46229  ORF Transcript_16689/g.46229 Transcript_16689/m.46229 type:complete len:241 (-) Transcript_16689:169-891(-)
MSGFERLEEVLLHVVHGLTVVDQLIHQNHLVRLLRGGVAELGAGELRGDLDALALDAALLVGRGLHEVHRVRARQSPAEVRHHHEGALKDPNQDDALTLAPGLDASRNDPDTSFQLLLGEDEAIVFLVLEVLRAGKRRLHVPVPLQGQELLRAGGRLKQHLLLLAVLRLLAREDVAEDALDEGRHGQAGNIDGVQTLDVLDARDTHRGRGQSSDPLREECLLVGKRCFQEFRQTRARLRQ